MAPASTPQAARAVFARAYAAPFEAALAHKANGGRVVGYMSANAPVELIEAAGMFALRLDGGGITETPRTDAFMERLFDPTVRGVSERLLSGELDFLDAVILPRTTDSVQRLYYYLCEQQRTGAAALPALILYDLLHTPWYSSAEHNFRSLTRVHKALSTLAGVQIDDAMLAAAIEKSNARRAALEACTAARRTSPPGMTGVEALQLFAAAQRLSPDAFIEASRNWRAAPGAAGAPRLVLAGNAPDTEDLHRAIEAAGAVVVGDYHDRGDLSIGAPIAQDLPPLRALNEHYHRHTRSVRTFPAHAEAVAAFAKSAGADGVVFFFYAEEEVLTWEYPGQQRALEAAGLPSIGLVAQPYTPDATSVQAAVEPLLRAIRERGAA